MGRANPVVWFDMDGVLADWDLGVVTKFGKPYSEFTDDEKADFWMKGCVANDWYANLDAMIEGVSLLRYAMMTRKNISHSYLDVRIITSTGGSAVHYSVIRQKAQWLERQSLPMRIPVVYVTASRHKFKYANPDDLLIDDNQDNCNQWQEAGGNAMLFTRDEACHHEIKRIIKRKVERMK